MFRGFPYDGEFGWVVESFWSVNSKDRFPLVKIRFDKYPNEVAGPFSSRQIEIAEHLATEYKVGEEVSIEVTNYPPTFGVINKIEGNVLIVDNENSSRYEVNMQTGTVRVLVEPIKQNENSEEIKKYYANSCSH